MCRAFLYHCPWIWPLWSCRVYYDAQFLQGRHHSGHCNAPCSLPRVREMLKHKESRADGDHESEQSRRRKRKNRQQLERNQNNQGYFLSNAPWEKKDVRERHRSCVCGRTLDTRRRHSWPNRKDRETSGELSSVVERAKKKPALRSGRLRSATRSVSFLSWLAPRDTQA